MKELRMNKPAYSFLLCLTLLCCNNRIAAQLQGTPDQVTTRFTAVNKNGTFAAALSKDDIRVTQDNVPATIIALERQSNITASVALLIDMSGSQERLFDATKAAAIAFINSVLVSGKDAAAIGSFTGEAILEQELTGELDRARTAIQRLQFVPTSKNNTIFTGKSADRAAQLSLLRSTAIWDAVLVACKEIFKQSPASAKRSLVLLSDGVDTFSGTKLTEAAESAIAAGVTVYAIGFGDDYNFEGANKHDLRKLTERTGGKTFFPKKVADLQSIFKQIEQEIHNNYVVTYSPSDTIAKGLYRKIEIELINPERKKEKIKLAHQHGYFQVTR